MSAEESLRSSEEAALSNNQIISSVTGNKSKKGGKMKKSFSAAAFMNTKVSTEASAQAF